LAGYIARLCVCWNWGVEKSRNVGSVRWFSHFSKFIQAPGCAILIILFDLYVYNRYHKEKQLVLLTNMCIYFQTDAKW